MLYFPNSETTPIKLANTLAQVGGSSQGIFFDTHPDWKERAERFKQLISKSSTAQLLIAKYQSNKEKDEFNTNQTQVAAVDFSVANTLSEVELNSQMGIKSLVEKDFKKAEKYIRLAADAGDTKAQYNLGLMYEKGDGVSKDLTLALKYIKQAADSKFPPALAKMGYFYKTGNAVQANLDEAVKYTKMAADAGDGTALFNLAQANINGDIKPPNKNEFERLMKLSAERGLSDGQAGWGSICLGRKDYVEAMKWYKLAASQNHGGAYSSMGAMYWSGLGVPKDTQEAMRLFKLAAKYGYQPAIDYLKKNNISYE